MSRAAISRITSAVDEIMNRPTWADVRRKVNQIAMERGEWGGYPMPVDHAPLIMEKRFPLPNLTGFKLKPTTAEDYEDPVTREIGTKLGEMKLLNRWYNYGTNQEIVVYQTPDGKSAHGKIVNGPGRRLSFLMDTLGIAAAEVWSVEAETEAVSKLKSMITDQAYKCYMLNGSFLETSKRSNVTYFFRKGRPTIALHAKKSTGTMGVLSVLCLHPQGHYGGTWAGCMTPTDDVITHLIMMRADEHLFWRKANHHRMCDVTSGI